MSYHIICTHETQEKEWEYDEAMFQLFINFKKVYDSFTWQVLYNIPNEFGMPIKLVRLLELHLNETYSRVCVGKH
jgi:hypothetical protein